MLRPTFLSFETAKQALNTSQLGLDTIGHNIANINSPGYTRQRVDQVSISSSGYKAKYQAYGVQFPGQGSTVIGINQIRDPFLDKRYRTEAANCGEYSAVSQGLTEINAVFDEVMSTGNHAKMGEFLIALDQLIAAADSKEQATVLRNKAEQIAQVLNKNAVDLDNVTTQQRSELDYSVDSVNSILEQIAMLNVKIKEDNFYGNPSNELNDERNLLLDQLSEYIDIDIKHTPVKITSDLTISQLSVNIRGTDINLVDSGSFNKLRTDIQTDPRTGEEFSSIHLVDGLSGLDIKVPDINGSSDITKKFMTGAIKGHLDILNGMGVHADSGQSSFRGIPYYRKALNDYASKFAEVMNSLNTVKVYDSTGEIGSISRPLFTSSDEDNPTITAGNIAVSKEWLTNSTYIETAARHNALYTEGGLLFKTNPDGGAPIATGIDFKSVTSVNAEGYLVGADGNIIQHNGEDLNISSLQRAVTEDTTYYEFRLADYADNGELQLKDGDTGKASGIALADVKVDDEGYLVYISDGSRVKNPDDATKDIHKNELFRVNYQNGSFYEVGAPAPNGMLPGASANDHLLAIKNAINGDIQFDNGFKGSFQKYMVSYQGDMALDQEQTDALFAATYKVLSGLADSRDAVSAVSIDEEGVNMMTYQNYYNAAARYMTVLDEALGTIIQGMGVVGR